MAKRYEAIDWVKFFAIIMVILGHCISNGTGAEYISNNLKLSNGIYIYIYSFHMALFALISGYLFGISVKKRNIKEIIQNRIQGLVIPILSWQVLISVFRFIMDFIKNGKFNIMTAVHGYLHIYQNMWFLWAMLSCSAIVIVIHYFLKDNILAYIIVLPITFLLKTHYLQLYTWLYPFFVLGFLARVYQHKWERINVKIYIPICFILHIIMVLFWKNDYYIYREFGSGLYILDGSGIGYHIFVNLYRIFAGLTGSITWIYIAYIISRIFQKEKYINKTVYLGSRYSLGIYVFSVYVLNTFLRSMTNLSYSIAYIIIETVAIFFISVAFMYIIDRFKYTRMLFLGGR